MKTAVLAAFKKEITGLLHGSGLSDEFKSRGPVRMSSGGLSGHEVSLIITGMGKVPAAIATQFVIDTVRPDRIVLCGMAGALSRLVEPLDLVVADKVLAHDTGPLPSEWSQTDRSLTADLLSSSAGVVPDGHAHTGAVVSGDKPLMKAREKKRLHKVFGAYAVDMEASAVVQAARANDIPVGVVKAVTDRADGRAKAAFMKNLPLAADLIRSVLIRFFENPS